MPFTTPSDVRSHWMRLSPKLARSTRRWVITSARDEMVLAMYQFTCQLATLEPPPPETQQLLGGMRGNQKAMDGFAQMNAGTLSPAEFRSPENIGTIVATSGAATP